MATRKTATDTTTEILESVIETDSAMPRQEVVKIGNLVKEGELRYTTKGQALYQNDLAVNPRPGTEGETEFYRLLVFGPLGENVSESGFDKSTRVIVVGSPDIEEWIDKETQETRTRKKIFVNAIGPDLRFATVDGITRVHRATAKPAVTIENF